MPVDMISGNLLDRIIFRIRNRGIISTIETVVRKISAKIIPPRIRRYDLVKSIASSKKGLEIGGPSFVFSNKGYIPVYPVAGVVDNLNFSDQTIWEGRIENQEFRYKGHKLGVQYIRDAIDLHGLPDNQYDFVMSSEMLQHIANPLRALYEWRRVIRENGYLILTVPNKEKTFDHRRPVTSLEHIIQDFKNNTQETDLTHLQEALELHDLSRDMAAGSFDNFKKRSENNHQFRALHHHIFDMPALCSLIEYAGFKVLDANRHLAALVLITQKVG